MWYAIVCEDVQSSVELRKQHRPAHLARLQALESEQRLLVAGPHPIESADGATQVGFTGSLIVADFENLQNAQEWADQDPFLLNGVYRRVTVKPFNKVFPSD